MNRKSRTVPPVLREMVRKRISELLHIGEPFTMREVMTKSIFEFADKLDDSERYHDGQPTTDLVNLIAHYVLKSPRFSGRAFRRWDRTSMKYERVNKSTVIYPSNDREKYHLGANEVFLPLHKKANDAQYPVVYGYRSVQDATEASDAQARPDSGRLAYEAASAALEAAEVGLRLARANFDSALRFLKAALGEVE